MALLDGPIAELQATLHKQEELERDAEAKATAVELQLAARGREVVALHEALLQSLS